MSIISCIAVVALTLELRVWAIEASSSRANYCSSIREPLSTARNLY